jgi:hypothetical protein
MILFDFLNSRRLLGATATKQKMAAPTGTDYTALYKGFS